MAHGSRDFSSWLTSSKAETWQKGVVEESGPLMVAGSKKTRKELKSVTLRNWKKESKLNLKPAEERNKVGINSIKK